MCCCCLPFPKSNIPLQLNKRKVTVKNRIICIIPAVSQILASYNYLKILARIIFFNCPRYLIRIKLRTLCCVNCSVTGSFKRGHQSSLNTFKLPHKYTPFRVQVPSWSIHNEICWLARWKMYRVWIVGMSCSKLVILVPHLL